MREIDKVIDKNEKILWEGSPSFWPFVLGGSIGTVIIGIIWMIFLIPFMAMAIFDILFGSHVFGFGILLMPHFWVGLFLIFGIPIYQKLVYKHTHYAITDKRIIFQKGLIGRDFQILDFDKITNAEVNVGISDKLFNKGNSGSIILSSAGSVAYTSRGAYLRPYVIRNIENPYEAFKFLKKVSHDVKTDIEYPNEFRPKSNPGYNTDYDTNKK